LGHRIGQPRRKLQPRSPGQYSGTLYLFSTAGNVAVEGSYNFNNKGTNASLSKNWQFLSVGYTWHDEYSANWDIGRTVNDLVKWFNDNKQTISEVVQIVGDVAVALG
jgi:hypothetical protein